MIGLLQRLLDPAYLYTVNVGPLGRWRAIYLAWAFLLLTGLAAALWWWRRARRAATTVTAAIVTAGACGAGLIAVGLRLVAPYLVGLGERGSPATRYLLLEAWTARVWPLSAALIALLVPIVYVLSRLRLPLVRAHVVALVGACGRPEGATTLPLWQSVVLAGLHLAGLAWLWYLAGRPLWWAVPSFLGLAALPLLARPRQLRLETLAPLFPAYLSAVVYSFLSHWLHVDVDEYQAFALPDPWSPWFNVPVVVAAGMAYTLLIQLQKIVCTMSGRCGPLLQDGFLRKCTLRERALPAGLALLVALWLIGTVAVHRTHGVTASDPYCYVQMAIDLAERGTARHEFPLAGLARELGLPTWPAVHIGYHPPSLDNRSPTMWSIGWPLLMVPLYWIGGLGALYWAAPLMSALALIATWGLATEALRDRPSGVRWTVAALTCALVATSPEGSERVLVPMADAAAQLFTVLTLWLLLRGRRGHAILYGALAGASFGVAYFVRHPQLPLGIAAMTAAIAGGRDALVLGSRQVRGSPLPERESVTRVERRRGARLETAQPATERSRTHRSPELVRGVSMLMAFGLAALVVVLPDLAYHRAAFGGWLRTESSEWFLISARNVSSTVFGILQQGLLRREEIGFLAPFVLYGAWLLWCRHRRAALVLFAGFLSVFLFHLFYAALRPRDLIALLPVLYLCAAYGFVAVWQRAQKRRTVTAALWLMCCMVFLFARSYRTLALPWREDVITFGHVRADQRQEYLKLRELTPQDAVVGSMLNSGAVELHAGRAAVHPAPWTEEELVRWTDGLLARGRPFFVLDDGEEMPAVLARLGRHYQVQPMQTLDLPYFAIGGGNLPRRARLYRVKPLR